MITKIFYFGPEQGFLWIKDDGVFYFWCIDHLIDENTDWKVISQKLYNACLNEAKYYKQKNVNVRFIEVE